MNGLKLESAPSVAAALFGGRAALLPSVTEVFELELAMLELGQLAPPRGRGTRGIFYENRRQADPPLFHVRRQRRGPRGTIRHDAGLF